MVLKSDFHTRLQDACCNRASHLCVGLDPRPHLLPAPWKVSSSATTQEAADSCLGFSRDVVDIIAPHVPLIKPQSAFFEALGYHGVRALEELSVYARSRGLLVLGDVKRGDIGSTAEAYAAAVFRSIDGHPLFDAVTVNPYLGEDGVLPFLERAASEGCGVFVLCKTSNPSSSQIQDQLIHDKPLHHLVASLINDWGHHFPGVLGAVVGGTQGDVMPSLRKLLSTAWLLIPGIGAQGASCQDALPGFDARGSRALVSASRSITFPWTLRGEEAPPDWQDAILQATLQTNTQLNEALSHG